MPSASPSETCDCASHHHRPPASETEIDLEASKPEGKGGGHILSFLEACKEWAVVSNKWLTLMIVIAVFVTQQLAAASFEGGNSNSTVNNFVQAMKALNLTQSIKSIVLHKLAGQIEEEEGEEEMQL
jgi:hypothetical protein